MGAALLALSCEGKNFWPFGAESEAEAPLGAPPPVRPASVPGKTAPIVIPNAQDRPVMVKALSESPPTEGAHLFVPSVGETDVYPNDYAIGSLRPKAPDDAYAFAKRFISDLTAGAPLADRFMEDGEAKAARLSQTLSELGGRVSARLGDAKSLPGGVVSYLVRFLSRTASVSGELYISAVASAYLVDEVILDKMIEVDKDGGEASYDPLRFDRFF